MPEKKWSKLAVWGFILSIISLLATPFFWVRPSTILDTQWLSMVCYLAMACWVLSLIFCLIVIKKEKFHKLATIGLVIDLIAIAVVISYFIKSMFQAKYRG